MRDGTFGTLAPLELGRETAQHVEQHRFELVRRVRYRNADLDYSSAAALLASLEAPPPAPHLMAVPAAVDHAALRALLADAEIAPLAKRGPGLELLWQVCQIPDFRKILFEVHVELLRDIYLRLVRGPLPDDHVAALLDEFHDERGDVDTLLSRTTRLRTWAYVAHRSDWMNHPEHWRQRIAALEDRLSDALHRSLVETFVERKGKPRPLPSASAPGNGRRASRQEHPLAALERFREVAAPERPAEAVLASLADAPHSAFSLDAHGEISAEGVALGMLRRGPSLTLPEVRLHELGLPAGVQSRLQRRLLAFARDSVGRLLEPFAALRSSEHAPLRAIAHQLERGLGSALTRELASSLAALTSDDHALLAALGIRLGSLGVFVPALLSQSAVTRRALFVRTHHPELRLPPLMRPNQRRDGLAPSVWLALGYVVVSDVALRIDLAERAAHALAAGRPEPEAMRPLGLPRRSARRIVAALRGEASASTL